MVFGHVLCVFLCSVRTVMSWEADSALPFLANFSPMDAGDDEVSSTFVCHCNMTPPWCSSTSTHSLSEFHPFYFYHAFPLTLALAKHLNEAFMSTQNCLRTLSVAVSHRLNFRQRPASTLVGFKTTPNPTRPTCLCALPNCKRRSALLPQSLTLGEGMLRTCRASNHQPWKRSSTS